MTSDPLSASLAEIRDSADMIIPWAKVQPGDLVLSDGRLIPVAWTESEQEVGPFGPVTLVRATLSFIAGPRVQDHAGSGLVAVRRLVTCALCGTVLARDGDGKWVRRDQPGRGLATCLADEDEEPSAHEPTVLDVADYARLRLALAELEEANARRCFH